MEEPKSVVVILSGGMDSATLLYQCLDEKRDIPLVLSFDYGQRHAKELLSACTLTQLWSLHHVVADMRWLAALLGGSALTAANTPVPHGHYEDESMRATVVPNRNLIMLSIAAAAAQGVGADAVAYGAHAGDHHIYPDCRPEFVQAFNRLACIGNTRAPREHVYAWAPYLHWSKGDIALTGEALGVPYELTWTCYEGGDVHCGQCGACVERREAFKDNGIPDRTAYRVAA